MVTQYGDADRQPDAGDALAYLAWCREWDRSIDR